MKHVKYFVLLSGLFFISTDIFCSEKKHQVATTVAAFGAGAGAYVSGVGGSGTSALIGAGAGLCYQAGRKGYKEYQEYRQREADKKKKAADQKVWDDRIQLVKNICSGTIQVGAVISSADSSLTTLSKLSKFFGS